MSEALILFGGDAPEAPMTWARVDGDGRILAQGICEVGDQAPAAQPSRTMLILSGAEARLRRLELPARTETQARAAAPYMFEGALADSQDVHYAVGGAQDAAGMRLAVALSARRLRQWLERCRGLGADPHSVTLDCTVWPAPTNEIHIVVTPERTIVAGGLLGGFAIEPSLAPAVFTRWLSETQAHGARLVLMDDDVAAWRAALGAQASRLEPTRRPDVMTQLARGALAASAAVPNLRQGDFGVAGRSEAPLRLWRFAALLAAAALLLQVGSLLVAGWRDAQAARQTMAAAERDFRELRPEARVVNLRAQVAALVNQLTQSARHPVLAASQPLAAVVRENALVRIDDMRHQAPGRSVRVQVSATDQAGVEAVVSALRAQGMTVEADQLPPRNGRYAAELTLEAPP